MDFVARKTQEGAIAGAMARMSNVVEFDKTSLYVHFTERAYVARGRSHGKTLRKGWTLTVAYTPAPT